MGRATQSPLAHLQPLNVKIDRRHDRRAFTVEEFKAVLQAAVNGPVRANMCGTDRALLYRLAVETGFRRGELASLTKNSIDFSAAPVMVKVEAAAAKAKKARCSPISEELAGDLLTHLEKKPSSALIFNVPPRQHSAKMIRADVDDARVAYLKEAKTAAELKKRTESEFCCYKNSRNEFLDFHALRHTRAVWLFQHFDVRAKDVQELLGVSSLALVDRYSRSHRITDYSFMKKAPDLTLPTKVTTHRAAGSGSGKLSPLLSPEHKNRGDSVEQDRTPSDDCTNTKSPQNAQKTAFFWGKTTEGMIPRSNALVLLDDLKSFFKDNPTWE